MGRRDGVGHSDGVGRLGWVGIEAGVWAAAAAAAAASTTTSGSAIRDETTMRLDSCLWIQHPIRFPGASFSLRV